MRLFSLLVVLVPGLSFAHQFEPEQLIISERQPQVFELRWRSDSTLQLERPVGCDLHQQQSDRLQQRVIWQCDESAARRFSVHLAKGSLLVRWVDHQVAELFPAGSYRVQLQRADQQLDAYFRLGLQHIATGYDHLLFVLCLMLIARRPAPILLAVSGFTLAHSITLAFASFGVLRLSMPTVEALIALSIVVLARELLVLSEDTLSWRRPAVAASVVGLLHGVGFAGALTEFGLPDDSRLWALALFNLGVEVGQLLFVAVVGAVILVIRRWVNLSRLKQLAAYAVGSTAMLWTLQRVI